MTTRKRSRAIKRTMTRLTRGEFWMTLPEWRRRFGAKG